MRNATLGAGGGLLQWVNRSCYGIVLHWAQLQEDRHYRMDDETKRRLVYGLLSLILGAIATRLAMYLTNRLLGEPEDGF